jgi:gas vesicle protein
MANGAGKFIGGFLLGSAVGATLGLLFAPKTGRETRRLLRKSADALPELANEIAGEITSNVQYQADRFTEQAGRTIDNTMERMQEAIAVGKDASQRLRQELNAMKIASPKDDDTL